MHLEMEFKGLLYSEFNETWYVCSTPYLDVHITRKFWSSKFCGSYGPLDLEICWNLACHRNSSEITERNLTILGMYVVHHM